MAKLAHVFDATRENFQRLVLDNSRKGLVLANYWTPQAPPCFKLWQELEALPAGQHQHRCRASTGPGQWHHQRPDHQALP
jgi:thioredoxin-like negative regulator of GroEL